MKSKVKKIVGNTITIFMFTLLFLFLIYSQIQIGVITLSLKEAILSSVSHAALFLISILMVSDSVREIKKIAREEREEEKE